MLDSRTAQLSKSEGAILIQAYANPVVRRLKLVEEKQESTLSKEHETDSLDQ